MNAFSKIDMAEVTRLTRAGKLKEAVALLQGQAPSGPAGGKSQPPFPASFQQLERQTNTIETAAPTMPGGAWSAPNPPIGPTAGEATQASKTTALPGFGRARRARLNIPSGLRPFSLPGEDANSASVPVPDGARFEERSFSNDAGSRTYKVYVPSRYSSQPLPVVVMLHGCTQSPDDFALGTRMNELAEEQTFLVAYPRQPRSANMQKCWNWFKAEDQQRDGGEPSLIAGIAMQVLEEFSADPARVYVAGLSAGGAAAAIMATTYPDLFAAVGVHSGLACGAARDMPSAFAAMSSGGAIQTRGAGPTVPTIVFHGDADHTVNLVNGDQVVTQATRQIALKKVTTRGVTTDGVSFTRTTHLDEARREILEHWVVHGAGHAWSGGSVNGSYADARGPDASREMIRFFLQHAKANARTRK